MVAFRVSIGLAAAALAATGLAATGLAAAAALVDVSVVVVQVVTVVVRLVVVVELGEAYAEAVEPLPNVQQAPATAAAREGVHERESCRSIVTSPRPGKIFSVQNPNPIP